MIRVAVVAEQTDQTNGWLKLKWLASTKGSVSGSWQSQNGKTVVPVTFQKVAQIWQVARHRPSSVPLEGVRVTEWTLYPVFYQHRHMEVITQALRRSWWHSLLGWEDFHIANVWKNWVDAEKFEPCELDRHVQLLGVSDNLVSIFSCAGTEVQLDSSTRREMWNYVKTKNGYRRYYLKDLFRPGTPWENRISTLCIKQLGPLPEQADQHCLTAENMAEFATLPAGLMIQFDPFIFGGGPDNDFHVMIPWSSLHDVLAPYGPARFFQPAQHKAESRIIETACNTSPFPKDLMK